MGRILFPIGCLLGLIVSVGSSARAEISGLTWDPVEGIDEDVAYPSASGGVSVLSWGERWWVVYEKYGDVYARSRAAGGWDAPVRLTTDPGPQTAPHVGATESRLIVVWEDHRGTQPEVWTRQFDGTSWDAEQCLSCDGIASRAPVIAAAPDFAFAAWQDSSAAEQKISGRLFRSGSWGTVERISSVSGIAREPSASVQSMLHEIMIAWSDSRHGDPEIYLRSDYPGEDWRPEQRMTDLPMACERPSLRSEDCCGDFLLDSPFIAFEGTAPGGVTETWTIDCYQNRIERLSADDGVPSVRPNAAAFAFRSVYCGWGGPTPHDFVTWSDQVAPGSVMHRTAMAPYCGPSAGEDLLARDGLSYAVLGAVAGSPTAGLLQAWVEDAGGMAVLLSRRGSMIGCSTAQVTGPPAVIVSPAGIPSNLLRFGDACSGLPLTDRLLMLQFSPELDAAIHWDPLQEHPRIERTTDAQGEAVFALRGGGCSGTGSVVAMCEYGFYPEIGWEGVKSPDVDGDCAVRDDDVAYVESRLGTNDFCADLDGSGLVGPEDVAIVRDALGQACSDVMDAPTGPISIGAPSLAVLPNPCVDAAVIRLRLSGETEGSIEIFDAGGRLVRALSSGPFPAGTTEVSWDLRVRDGRIAPAGVYYVRAHTDRVTFRRPLLVTR